MQNAGYLLAAFAIIWALLFGYVLVMIGRQRHLSEQIVVLQEEIKAKAEKK